MSTLSFTLENQVSNSGLVESIDLFDYVAGTWVNIASQAASQGFDTRITAPSTSPNRFIQSGTRQVKARIRLNAAHPIATLGWQTRIDQAIWSYAP